MCGYKQYLNFFLEVLLILTHKALKPFLLFVGPNDWSWRIRFGSIQSLVKICRCLSNDKNREGMRTAAWNILIRAHSMEKDDRVLEALKVGQVGASLRVHTGKIITFLRKSFFCCWIAYHYIITKFPCHMREILSVAICKNHVRFFFFLNWSYILRILNVDQCHICNS